MTAFPMWAKQITTEQHRNNWASVAVVPLKPGSFDRGQTNQKNFMTNPAVRKNIQIDRVSSAAICEEVGDRLRIGLTGKPERMPQHLRMLVEQIAKNDSASAVLSAKRNRI
jgi:hypothetical protein